MANFGWQNGEQPGPSPHDSTVQASLIPHCDAGAFEELGGGAGGGGATERPQDFGTGKDRVSCYLGPATACFGHQPGPSALWSISWAFLRLHCDARSFQAPGGGSMDWPGSVWMAFGTVGGAKRVQRGKKHRLGHPNSAPPPPPQTTRDGETDVATLYARVAPFCLPPPEHSSF